MNRRKNLLALAVLMCLTTLISAGNVLPNNILPRIVPAQAAQCPTGGSTSPCLVVNLSARSSPVTSAGQVCAAQSTLASQKPVCDIALRPTASNATSFRVGVVLNSTAGAGSAVGVFGWQFGINY